MNAEEDNASAASATAAAAATPDAIITSTTFAPHTISGPELMVSTVELRGNNVIRPRKRGGRRRAPEMTLSAEETMQIIKRLRVTMDHSHAKRTVDNYMSYIRTIHDYWSKNHPEMVDFTKIPPQIDRARFRAVLQNPQQCKEWFKKFAIFIRKRTHLTRKNADGTPAPARIDSLNGYRAAFAWLIWTSDQKVMPVEWNLLCKHLWRCLLREEGRNDRHVLH